MRLREVVAVAVGVLALGVPASAIGSTLIGNYDQADTQGTDSSQSAINGSGSALFSGPGPVKYISGNSTPTLKQTSTNLEGSDAEIGNGDGVMIGDGNQLSHQGLNSQQTAKKGTQTSTNVALSTQLVDLTTSADVVIGGTNQVNSQAGNSEQSASSRPGSVVTVILGPVNKAPETEASTNLLISCEAVIGLPGC